ncbi:AfsR/SARP family transcriptional regulator [Nocardia heshunensis]
MQIGLLGSVLVTAPDGAVVEIGGARVRALLALLASQAGRPVPPARLIDDIWGEDLPTDAVNALQTLVKRLRAMLPGIVVREPGGYMLALADEAIDVLGFTAALNDGRSHLAAGHVEAAARCFDTALGLWRGEPLVDVGESPGLSEIAAGLTELRLTALELRADAYEALGRSEEVIRDLGVAVAAHSLRETLAARLIRALVTVGRRSEALQVFQRTEAVLRDELAIEPSPGLRHTLAEIHLSTPVNDVDNDPVPPTRPSAAIAASSTGRAAIEAGHSVIVQSGRDSSPTPRHSIVSPVPSGVLVSQAINLVGAVAPSRGEVWTHSENPVLPRRFTSFLGRGPDVQGVLRLLGLSRLVTLIGSGGVGKTRLASEMLDAHGRHWPDGCVFVDLATVDRERSVHTQPSAVGVAISAALGQVDYGGQPTASWVEVVSRSMDDRRMLLVLDNCEHVVDAAAYSIELLLRRLPLLTVLTTSREALGAEGERLYPVRPLAVPGRGASLTQAENSPAVRLFTDRVAAVRPDFSLSEDTCADVCAIVQGLEGVPLAIELAAARLQALPLRDVADRVADRFQLLTSTSRSSVPRHRSLRAAIAWSWELLTDAESRMARRFSVFAGGATLEAISRMSGEEVIDVLGSLVAKSLVEFDGERYRMVESIRAYAAEQLDHFGEHEELAAALFDYMVEFTDAVTDGLLGPHKHEWMLRIAAEHSNCVAALNWALRSGDADRVQRLYGNVVWGWLIHSVCGVVSGFRRDVLTLVGERPPAENTAALLVRRSVEDERPCHTNSEPSQIRSNTEEFTHQIAMATSQSRPHQPVFVLNLALHRLLDGDDRLTSECADAATNWLRDDALFAQESATTRSESPHRRPYSLEAAVQYLSVYGDPRSHSKALLTLASYRTHLFGLATAVALVDRAVGLLDDSWSVGERVGVLCLAADLHLLADDIDTGANYLARAEELLPAPLPTHLQRLLLADQAHLALRRGNLDCAIELYRQLHDPSASAGSALIGPTDGIGLTILVGSRTYYAVALLEAGRPDAAARELIPAREMATTMSSALLAEVAVVSALIADADARPEHGARILGVVDRLNRRLGVERVGPDHKRALTRVRAALGSERFVTEFAAGEAVPDTEVIALLEC